MLAAQCVCSLLQAEHSVIRQTLATLDEVLRAQGWRQPGAPLNKLRTLMRFLKSFQDGNHRPKENDHLLPVMRGRCTEADRVIAALEDAQLQGNQLLSRALRLIDGVAAGEAALAVEFAAVMKQHEAQVLRQLDSEDHVLFSLARQLLSEEEWSTIASAMSRMPYPPNLPYEPSRPELAHMTPASLQRPVPHVAAARAPAELRPR
ncbi:hemerythrin domain-containing protein [Caldimonas brevitalea]|uniref:Hemerythrin-like domain-containing protein n=1 Tax=Caldimonas brevitalea TaxID=413882 RepID=A0A0G3BMY8_9BURK|nr:hemerythrin domain-containing protein [Caldimonas brevitalea]AKJ29338.1 hypothetical protein AAW51_2647 [Caldimonas brevitalea]